MIESQILLCLQSYFRRPRQGEGLTMTSLFANFAQHEEYGAQRYSYFSVDVHPCHTFPTDRVVKTHDVDAYWHLQHD